MVGFSSLSHRERAGVRVRAERNFRHARTLIRLDSPLPWGAPFGPAFAVRVRSSRTQSGTFSRVEKERQLPGPSIPRTHVRCSTARHREAGRGLLRKAVPWRLRPMRWLRLACAQRRWRVPPEHDQHFARCCLPPSIRFARSCPPVLPGQRQFRWRILRASACARRLR